MNTEMENERKNNEKKSNKKAVIITLVTLVIVAGLFLLTIPCIPVKNTHKSEAEESMEYLHSANEAVRNAISSFIESLDADELEGVIEDGLNELTETKETIDNSIKENILNEVIDSVSGAEISGSDVYDWLEDYNQDGVKDILDYNMWKNMQPTEGD